MPAAKQITVRLPFLLPTRNEQDRMHFQEKKRLKDRIIAEFIAAGIRRGAAPMEFAEVTVWRNSARSPDYDGNVGSLKQLLDVIQPEGIMRFVNGQPKFPNPGGLGIILNDNIEHVVVRAEWVKAKPSEQYTLVRIKALDGIPVAA